MYKSERYLLDTQIKSIITKQFANHGFAASLMAALCAGLLCAELKSKLYFYLSVNVSLFKIKVLTLLTGFFMSCKL